MSVVEERARSIRVLVTGDREDLETRLPSELGFNGLSLEWIPLPVLRFERLKVDEDQLRGWVAHPPDWIIFTSHRSVRFWSELLLEHGLDFPIETQVACIGERTAESANLDGFTPDFFPTEPGSEKFLEEFEHLLSNNTLKPQVLMPMAQDGRGLIPQRLQEVGCQVTTVPLYKTLPREDLGRTISQEEIQRASLLIFTSPSSVEAFTRNFKIPDEIQVACLGQFTANYLTERGIPNRILPAGDFERVGELLC